MLIPVLIWSAFRLGQAGATLLTFIVAAIAARQIDTNQVMIMISDNGTGIPEEICSKLFDLFFTTKPVGKGTGLGLFMSYQIVTQKHGGNLWCESALGQGTKFTIEIPVKANKIA